MLRTHTKKSDTELNSTASLRFGHDFSQIPVHARAAGALQTKLSVSVPGDQYEQEADRTAERVMWMEAPALAHTAPPAIQRLGIGFQETLAAKQRRHLCTECEGEELQRRAAPTGAGVGRYQVPHQAEAKVGAVSGGQPLTSEQRAFFEPRFGADFSRVRIHTDRSADAAARAVGALAFTRGSDIVFRGDQYRPHAFAGQRLLAHELTHVVQQGAAPGIQQRHANEGGGMHALSNGVLRAEAGHVLQLYPGDGMSPPGDCSWSTYIPLRGAVETAKVVVQSLGGCAAGDSCTLLATKIAAISAEIAARVVHDAKCFKGGNTGHRQQVQDKITMLNRCYPFFTRSGCSPDLIEAMEVVVEAARAVIAAAALAVALALVVALIAAIVALAKVIAAAVAAAAAEAALVAGAVAAVVALLAVIKENIGSGEGPPEA